MNEFEGGRRILLFFVVREAMKLYTFTRMPALALSTAPPRVTLLSAPQAPYDGAIAAARTCYSPRVITRDEVTDRQRDSIGPLTFEGGHHTVFQHAHFEFGLENVSRQFVWSFLHSHPFYNSEQSSQRFVRLDEIRAYVPAGLAGAAREVYRQALAAAWQAYRGRPVVDGFHRRPNIPRGGGPVGSARARGGP